MLPEERLLELLRLGAHVKEGQLVVSVGDDLAHECDERVGVGGGAQLEVRAVPDEWHVGWTSRRSLSCLVSATMPTMH